jgi:hypothetical protein
MIEFKKRLRLLAAVENYEIDYLAEGSLRFSKDDAVLQLNPKSKRFATCSVLDKNDCFQFDIQKEFVFDAFLRFRWPESRKSLRNYDPGTLLTLEDYIHEENGQGQIDELRSRLAAGPVDRFTCGGNKLFVEYYAGIIVILDDCMTASSNVIEFA